jgi:hypothetical protein
MRLTRYAPARMLCNWAADIPDRLDRILPESLLVSVLDLKRGGGAKSSAVNVPDFRRACLNGSLVSFPRRLMQTGGLTGWASPPDRQMKMQAAGGQEEQVSRAAAHL